MASFDFAVNLYVMLLQRNWLTTYEQIAKEVLKSNFAAVNFEARRKWKIRSCLQACTWKSQAKDFLK
jgi:hypothetical protein